MAPVAVSMTPPNALPYVNQPDVVHAQWMEAIQHRLSLLLPEGRDYALNDVYPPLEEDAKLMLLAGDPAVFRKHVGIFTRLSSVLGLVRSDYVDVCLPQGEEQREWQAFIEQNPIVVTHGTGAPAGSTAPPLIDLRAHVIARAIAQLDRPDTI